MNQEIMAPYNKWRLNFEKIKKLAAELKTLVETDEQGYARSAAENPDRDQK